MGTMRAFKRFSTFLALVTTLALTLTGCVHMDRSVTVNSDGSGSYTLTLGLSEQLVSLGGDQISTNMDSFGAKVKSEGGSYRHYDDTGYTYWAYTRPFKSIATLNQLLQETPNSDTSSATGGVNTPSLAQDTLSFSEQSGLLTNSFHVTGHMSLKLPQDTTSAGGVDFSQYLNDMRESFSVTMPGWVTSHKGGDVSGNTVAYTVHYGQEADIDVVGGGYNTAMLIPVGAGAVVVLALIAIIAAVLMRRRGKRGTPAEPAPAYVAAGPDAPTVPGLETPPSGAGQD